MTQRILILFFIWFYFKLHTQNIPYEGIGFAIPGLCSSKPEFMNAASLGYTTFILPYKLSCRNATIGKKLMINDTGYIVTEQNYGPGTSTIFENSESIISMIVFSTLSNEKRKSTYYWCFWDFG